MTKRTRTAAGLAVLGLLGLLATIGCEDTGVTAPAGSAITLIAQPSNISIDQDAGDTAGSTLLRAQLLDSTGLPQRDVPLSFTTSGGVLASISNICVDLDEVVGKNCLRSGDACVVDSDCPLVEPIVQTTDPNGLVTDILVLRLFQDPETVEVTVQSNISSSSIMVGTNINLGPDQARAVLAVSPEDRARTGQEVQFNGASSTDGAVRITCYEFEINETITTCPEFDPDNPDLNPICTTTTNTEISRQSSSIFGKTYGMTRSRVQEFDLSAVLRVSDSPITPAEPCVDPANRLRLFSQFEDGVSGYEVRCDYTDPIVDGGPNVVQSLSTDGGSVPLNANGFDDESPRLFYQWDCGTSAPPQNPSDDGSSVTCEYTTSSTEPRTATVTVFNECGRIATDNVSVFINP